MYYPWRSCVFLYRLSVLSQSDFVAAAWNGRSDDPQILATVYAGTQAQGAESSLKQALYSLSSSLSAGRSVENGFRDAVQDLLLLDPGGQSDLIFELKVIVSRLEYGEPIEVALQDFARRAGMEDIANFADVFSTCKRTGGDLVEVVRRTSSVIGEKLDIQQEISVMIAQKRFESKALLAAPFLLLLFMNLTSPDYMETMYSGPGIMISTFALAALGGCFLWISKMMNIKV